MSERDHRRASTRHRPGRDARARHHGDSHWLALQRGAGNAAVARLIRRTGQLRQAPAATRPMPLTVSRWTSLGEHGWDRPFGGKARRSVMVGTEAEWRTILQAAGGKYWYDTFVRGFLEAATDPSMVGRKRHPNAYENYFNTISRAPNDDEIMNFMRALYSLGDKLSIPSGGGAAFYWEPQLMLAELIGQYQGRIIREVSEVGKVISPENVKGVAGQAVDLGSSPIRTNMIINAGATAMKGIDLLRTASDLPTSSDAEKRAHTRARGDAKATIKNAGRTIRAVLAEHRERVAARQATVSAIFDTVWSTIPGGGALAAAAKTALGKGLEAMLKQASASSDPEVQAKRIFITFSETVRSLEGVHLDDNDSGDAITGFEAALM